MAGIGFVLRKLLQKGTVSGMVQAYWHATLASSGQWLFAVFVLGSFFILTEIYHSFFEYNNFRLIILYNFTFSILLTAPIVTVSTRYLADLIYNEDVSEGIGMLLGTMTVVFFITIPIVSWFYLSYINLQLPIAFLAVINFLLIASVWQMSAFISALKYYSAITWTFIAGMMISFFLGLWFATSESILGMLAGFSAGLAFILASLIALIFVEYPAEVIHPFGFLKYMKKYWELPLGAVFYNLGIWIDKWIMWFSPESVVLPSGMRMYPDYDSAMFISYLTIIPTMAMFVVKQETFFYEKYIRYYRDLLNNVNLDKINYNFGDLMNCLKSMLIQIFSLQISVCFITLLLAPKILELLNFSLIQLSMFRYGVLGASFLILTLLLIIILYYFDNRKAALGIQLIFFLTNTLFTIACLHYGFTFYGFGFFISALLTFCIALVIAEKYIQRLTYHTFITRNELISQQYVN